jgi:CRISPR-associated protein Csx10
MKLIPLTASLESPMAIVSRRQDEVMRSRGDIPGRSLRGAIAARAGERWGEDSRAFKALVLQEARWPDLLPSLHDKQSYPLPLTAKSCKRHPGFENEQNEEDDEPAHGMVCELADLVAEGLGLEGGGLRKCRVCDEDLKSQRAFAADNRRVKFKTATRMHVGIDAALGAARAGILYGVEALQPEKGKFFWGEACLNAEAAGYLKALVDEDAVFFIGRGSSRGYGRIKLSLEGAEGPRGGVEDWSQSFMEALQKRGYENSEGCWFSISGRSPCLFLDRLLRPTASFPNLGLGEELRGHVYDWVEVAGWSAVHGLPRAPDMALAPGSVWLFWSSKSVTEITERLEQLRLSGVGSRRSEGLGDIVICDPFFIEKCTPTWNRSH